MKNEKIILVIILSICIIMTNSCKKNNGVQLPSDLVSYLGFAKNGSYYVFQDSVSGNIDTFKVNDYYIGSSISSIAYSYITTYSQQIIYLSLYIKQNDTAFAVDMSFEQYGIPVGSFIITYMGAKFDSITPLAGNDSIITSILPAYSVNNIIYKNVLYFNNIQESPFYSGSDYWIAKDIGIVQIKNRWHNWNWKLISKNIVQ